MMSKTTASSLRPYVYDVLPKGDALRYLTLHPGGDKDALECSLHATLMDEAPLYEAVSYVWGISDLEYPIICDGKVLLITSNLAKVLRRSRLRVASRTLWADSICINQKDLKEKGHQVAIMSRIYQRATCVLMHMGEDYEGHGSRVQSLLEDVTRMIENELKKICRTTWDSFPYYEKTPFVDDQRWISLSVFLKQEWFNRGWVVREAALAQHGWVIWGQSEFGWTQLMLTLVWLQVRAWEIEAQNGNITSLAQTHFDAYVDHNIREVSCFMRRRVWRRNSVLDYLAAGRKLRMTDPRDRLYAFLDMPTEEEGQIQVDPNYEDAIPKVYHSFARQYIRTTNSPKILDRIIHDAQSLQSSIPTWVPDWDYRGSEPTPSRFGYEKTSRTGAVCKPMLIGERLLKVRGVVLEPVTLMTSVFDGPTTTTETLAGIWAAVRLCNAVNPYSSSYPIQAFISALTETTGKGHPNAWAQQRTHYLQVLEGICNAPDRWTHEEHDHTTSMVQNWIKAHVHSKRLFLTERGYMGLSPAVAQEGDMCGIIFGCTLPCILRKTSQEHHFKFIGPCSILGQQTYVTLDGYTNYGHILGSDDSKDWVDWDIGEQDIYLC
ncbi:uncharacterized protein EKO05_0003140 [Ascochyta rabiei]|uniref:uncharacterized protein n=1 Tax=Didymella rabiei TaxID=5454 RepID=UPI0019002B64|nr:uncharacterized protein EKO05_0003140 [Ascochyta rabiei]UPX12598.1 hypothetical protein EKO05_0003140 [Ascochyta rabiei]